MNYFKFTEPKVKEAKSKVSTWINVENSAKQKKSYLDQFKVVLVFLYFK